MARRGISVEDFFFTQQLPSAMGGPGGKAFYHALLSGPPHCGKTSLLLQFAYNSALDKSSSATFICKRGALDINPPYATEGVDPSSDVFARVTMKYVSDDEELRMYFAAFHTQSALPCAVVVDNFYDIFDERKCRERYGQMRAREMAMVRTLALCHDSINYANERLVPDLQCRLVISDTYGGKGPRLQYMYQRWLPQIFTIRAFDRFTFSLTALQDEQSQNCEDVRAVYSLQNTLRLLHFEKCPK